MPENKRKILVTSALPYSNGDIHLGHLVEYLQTDFWVRFQKMRGHECVYFCADDTHGTPVMIAAKQQGRKPEEMILEKRAQHLKDFVDFEIEFTHYSSTHSKYNKKFSEEIFKAMEAGGHITEKKISQYYCEASCKMFLPDRFIKGKCPSCGAEEQYGDSCEKCGATYSSIDVVEPVCVTCGGVPSVKESEHLFFELSHFQEFLSEWVNEHTSKEVAKKLKEWFKEDLRAWDISRDSPYFGFEIPGHAGKYFYVWVDAPVGYIATTEEWCKEIDSGVDGKRHSYLDYWKNQDCEIYHFIGKDIVYFHSLFWPAMLYSAGLSTPTKVFTHGFLTVNKEKMSKSKGTFINARSYLNHLPPTALRYYFATKISDKAADIDFNTTDFINKINSEMVGKITNLASRSIQLIHNKLDGRLGVMTEAGKKQWEKMVNEQATIAIHYEQREFSTIMVMIRQMAEEANQYLEQNPPWKLIKTSPGQALDLLTDVLNFFKVLAVYLTPILPSYSARVKKLLSKQESKEGEVTYLWSDLEIKLENEEIKPYEYLIERIDDKAVDLMLSESTVAS